MKGRLALDIPNDWNKEDDGYNVVLFCIPNSTGWRVVINSLISLLTAGRTWNRASGNIKEAQAIGREIFNSMGTCETLVEQLTRIADGLNTVDGQGNPVAYLQYLQHLETLGAIPGAGDSIQTSLQKVVARLPTDLTLDELIIEINNNPNLSKFKDFLEILTFIKDLIPGINLPLPNVIPLLSALIETRYTHNQLTISAYQATALRGIQNALTPFDGGEAEDEESVVKDIYDRLDKMPWLLTAVAALAEPTPAGETVAAAKMATTAVQWFNWIRDGLLNWWNSWANSVENPTPATTVTGSLLDISRKLARDSDAYAGSSNPVSLFGILQGLGLTQLHDDGGNLVSTADSLVNLAETLEGLGLTQTGIYEEIQNMQIGPFNINVDNCCDGASGDPPPEGQPVEEDPPLDDGGGFPPVFDDQQTYDEYKCRAAHQLRKYLADIFDAIGTSVVTHLDNRTWGNGIKIWDYLDSTKYNYLPNAVSYNLTPSAISAIVQQIVDWYLPAWRGQLFTYDGPQAIPINGYTHFKMLRSMADVIRADGELICNLLADGNATNARSSIGLALSEATTVAHAALPSDQQPHWDTAEVSDWTTKLVTNALVNILFVDSAYNLVLYADCSHCFGLPDPEPDCQHYHLRYGVETSEWNFDSVFEGGEHRVVVNFGMTSHSNNGPWCGPRVQLTLSLTGWEHVSTSVDNFRVYADDVPPINSVPLAYSDDYPPDPGTVLCCRRISIIGKNPFSVHVNPIDIC